MLQPLDRSKVLVVLPKNRKYLVLSSFLKMIRLFISTLIKNSTLTSFDLKKYSQ